MVNTDKKVNPRIMQIRLDRRIEESGDRTWIELFQSAMVNTGISILPKPYSLLCWPIGILACLGNLPIEV